MPLTVRDLDSDGEPEVLLDLNSYGTQCCAWVRIYNFDRKRQRYALAVNHFWGRFFAAGELRDLDDDRRPEFVSVDDRFQDLSYFAYDPIQIWVYDRGSLRDVTGRFPTLVAADAAYFWREYQKWLRKRWTPGTWSGAWLRREALAAWLADQYLLGRVREANRVLARAVSRGDLSFQPDQPNSGYLARDPHTFARQLKAFLRKSGYA